MEISRGEFLTAVKACMVAVNKPDALGSHCIHFDKAGFITTFNDYLGVKVQLPIDFTADVDGLLLYRAIQNFKDDIIKITLKEDGVEFKCGRSKTTLRLQDVPISRRVRNILPTEESDPPFELPSDFTLKLSEGILKEHPKTSGVYISGDNIVSTNNVIIYHTTSGVDLPTFRLSYRMVGILKGYAPQKVQLSNAWAFFTDSNVTIMCRLMYADDYPFVRIIRVVDAFKQAEPMVMGTKVPGLYEAVKTSIAFVDDSAPVVTLGFNKAGVDVYVDSNGTEYSEYLDGVFAMGDEENVDIQLPPSLLTGILKESYDMLSVKEAMGKVALTTETEDTINIVLVGDKKEAKDD